MTREEVKYASKDYVNYLLDKQEYHNEKYTEHDIKQAFEEGAKLADEYPKNPWISAKDDLPCNHPEMLNPTCNIKTQYVITSIEGLCYINKMVKYRNKWIWEMDKPTHWMPIPKLPQELDYVRD